MLDARMIDSLFNSGWMDDILMDKWWLDDGWMIDG